MDAIEGLLLTVYRTAREFKPSLLRLVIVAWCAANFATFAQTPPPSAAPAQSSVVGSWLVTVEGENATRTLIVTEEAPTSDGALLAAKYGMTTQGQGPIEAKMLRVGDQRQLVLITQAGTKIVATEQPNGNFQGTFTLKDGGVKQVTIARASEEAQAPLRQSTSAQVAVGNLQWRVGDRWEYERTDLWNGSKSSAVYQVIGRRDKSFVARSPGYAQFGFGYIARPQEEVITESGMVVSDRAMGSTYEHIAIQLPLTIGLRWTTREYWGTSADNAGSTRWSCKVAAREMVETPGGMFDAFRIDCEGFYSKLYGSGYTKLTRWYSESARWFVKAKYMDRFGAKLWAQEEAVLISLRLAP